MAKNQSQAIGCIRSLYRASDLNEEKTYRKARLLLGIYRDVCWSAIGRSDEAKEDLELCGGELDRALTYLEIFAPEEERDRFETKVKSLFETRWMVELMERAMMKSRDFPHNGELYFEILSKCYLDRFKYTEAEILEVMHLERSCYYERKKEAILVFGLSLWGGSIMKLKKYLASESASNAEI